MFEKLDPSNPECEGSQVDVEEWINEYKGIVVSCTIAIEDLINAIMNPDSESKTCENKSSEEEIVTEKVSWIKAANMCSTLKTFAKSWPCYSAQEVMQLHILHSTFLQKSKECMKQADILQIFLESL
jgi:hypothetical protein